MHWWWGHRTCLYRHLASWVTSSASNSSTGHPESLWVQGWGRRSISLLAEWETQRWPEARLMGALQVGQRKVLCTHTPQMRWPFLQQGTGAVRMVSMQTGHSSEPCSASTSRRCDR